MYTKNHKNWEKIKRLRGYTPYKYPRIINLKPTRLTWIIEALFLFLFIFPANILLLFLFISDRNTFLVMPIVILSGMCVLIMLHLWKLISIIWKVSKK
jgi:hypothetical protein